jgi:phosphopantothenoylcysteine decarboxylase/phosphopantothenate--cysteine ligase
LTKRSRAKAHSRLVKNPDIAKAVGKVKGDKILVVFSAETNDLLQNAGKS